MIWSSNSTEIGLLLFELWFSIVDGCCDGVENGSGAVLAKFVSRVMPFDATKVACCRVKAVLC